jgi:hypothetical protein
VKQFVAQGAAFAAQRLVQTPQGSGISVLRPDRDSGTLADFRILICRLGEISAQLLINW